MTSRLTRAITNGQTVSAYATRYEALRNHTVERNIPVARYGLAVLLRQGVAAWMDAWSKVPAQPLQPAKDEQAWPCPLPAGSSAEVVHVLAAMTLGHMQEVHP